ncbi:MAG: AAA family ATPase [Pseudomonadota bacterium]
MRFQFLNFIVDAQKRELSQGGRQLHISPKNFEVLVHLVQNRDRMVPKSELMERFWSNNISDAALQKSISQLRRHFTDADETSRIIRTYHGRGFRFVADTERADAAQPSSTVHQTHLRETRLVTLLCALLPADNSHAGQAMERAQTTVESFGGTLKQPLIDGFIASFGNSPVSEDSARLAAHCAWEMQGPDDMAWRIGLENGAIALDDMPHQKDWHLPGKLERAAAHLAQSAQPNETLLSAAVLDQCQDEFEIEPSGHAFRLLRVGSLRTGIPGRPRKRVSRYVGRKPDLGFLQSQLEMAAKGKGQAVALSGAPGIGKTRLVHEFLAQIDPHEHRCELAHCLPGLQNSPYAPLGPLCRSLMGRPSHTTLRDDIDQALWRSLTDQSAPADAVRLGDLSDRQRHDRILALLTRLFQEASDEKTLVIVIEDVHWLDPASRALLTGLVVEAECRSWMIVLTTRPVETPPPTERTLHLGPLTRAESAELLEDAAHGAALSHTQLATLVERADGNPFFIEELALTAASGGDPATDLPATVTAVIAARIGNLDTEARQLIYVIAVLGTPADPARVCHLLKQSRSRVAVTIEKLIRLGFVIQDARHFVFKHMLINDTAYAMIDPDDRRTLHAEIAAMMEAAKAPERPERLAWHHQEAGNIAQAIAHWTAASRTAIHRAAWTEAATFSQNGLALLNSDIDGADAMELDLLLCRAPALIALRGFPAPEVGDAYKRASQLNRRVGNPKTEIRVRVGQWINTWVRGELTESLRHAETLVALSKQYPDPALILQGHASRGQVLMHMGRLPEAYGQLLLGLDAIEAFPPETAQAQNAAVSCAAYASWVASMMGERDQAIALVHRSRELADLRHNTYATAIHHALCLETHMFLGDLAACLEYSDTAIRVSTENEYAFWLGTGLVMRGWCLGQRAEYEAALDTIREGIDIFAGTGAGVQLANWHGLHAEILLRSSDNHGALAEAQRALDCAASVGDIYFCPRIHRVMSNAFLEVNEPAKATLADQRCLNMAKDLNLSNNALTLG